MNTIEQNYKNFFNFSLSFVTSKYNIYSKVFTTPLGKMLGISSKKHLLLLQYLDSKMLEKDIIEIRKFFESNISLESNDILEQTKLELESYFAKELKTFTIPTFTIGTNFRKNVWDKLQKIEYGSIFTYKDIAIEVGNKNACRAVGTANSLNKISIIIPCHRVINSNGNLGGYASGTTRKKWLLDHEQL